MQSTMEPISSGVKETMRLRKQKIRSYRASVTAAIAAVLLVEGPRAWASDGYLVSREAILLDLFGVLSLFVFFVLFRSATLTMSANSFFTPEIPFRGLILGLDLGERSVSDIVFLEAITRRYFQGLLVHTRQGDRFVIVLPPRRSEHKMFMNFLTQHREDIRGIRGAATWSRIPDLHSLFGN